MSLAANNNAARTAEEREINVTLQHPDTLETQTALKESVWRLLELDDNERTKKAYQPKMKEYYEFVKTIYPDDPQWLILQRDKMYRFMYYLSFRNKKKVGGTRAGQNKAGTFDVEAYQEVMKEFNNPTIPAARRELPRPENPISPATFSQYKQYVLRCCWQRVTW